MYTSVYSIYDSTNPSADRFQYHAKRSTLQGLVGSGLRDYYRSTIYTLPSSGGQRWFACSSFSTDVLDLRKFSEHSLSVLLHNLSAANSAKTTQLKQLLSGYSSFKVHWTGSYVWLYMKEIHKHIYHHPSIIISLTIPSCFIKKQ